MKKYDIIIVNITSS